MGCYASLRSIWWCWLLSDPWHMNRYCGQYMQFPASPWHHLVSFKRKSHKSPKTTFHSLSLYISNSSYVFHIFSEKRASFPAFASSFLSLLGAIYYFTSNYAGAHCMERCWIASPPPETRREGMLQETQQRFPAPCKLGPFHKKSTGEQFVWKTPAMQNKVSLYCFFHQIMWLPFMNNERGYQKLINIQNQ